MAIVSRPGLHGRCRSLLGPLCVCAVLGVPAMARADGVLDAWRDQVTAARALAENDAQSAYRDAQRLQAALPADAEAADRARILNLLARTELHFGLIAESARHGEAARELAKQNNDATGEVEADLNISLDAINQGQLDDMITATQDGMGLLENIRRDDLRAEEMFQGAMMYLRFGQLDEAVTVSMQALDVARNSGNPLVRAYAEQSMAVVYSQSGHDAEAGEHYQKMLQAARAAHSTLLEAAAILGLSAIASEKGSLGDSERLIMQAIALFERVGAPLYVNHARHILADQYRREGQTEKAVKLLTENANSYEKYNNPIGLWWTLQLRSLTLQGMGRLAAASGDAERSYALAQKIGFNIYLGGSARRLAEVAAEQGDFKLAYRWSAEAAKLKEKADREKSGKRIVELAQRFREESKQRRIDELTRQSQIQDARQRMLWTLLGSIVVLLAGTMFFLRRLGRINRRLEAEIDERQRMQEALATKEREFRTLAENLPDNLVRYNAECRAVYANPSMVKMLGGDAAVLIGRTPLEAHPDAVSVSIYHRALAHTIATGEPGEIEIPVGPPGAPPRFHLIRFVAERRQGGEIRGALSIGRDITERKLSEQELRMKEYIIDHASEAIYIRGPDHRFIYVNEVACQNLGYRREELLGKTPLDINLDASPKLLEQMAERMAERESLTLEGRHRRRDGSTFPVELQASHIEYNGQTMTLTFVRDITERKRAEDELARYREHLEELVNERTAALEESRASLAEAQRIAHVGSWEMNLVDNVLSWSDEIYRIFEIDPQRFGASYEAFVESVHPEDRQRVDQTYQEALEIRRPFEIEHRLLLPDGRIKYVHERCETIYAADGRPLRSIGTVQDVTELKLAEQQLKRALAFTDQLINAIPDPVFVKDREHKWLRLNDAFCELIGQRRDVLIGKSDYDFFPATEADIFWEKDELVFSSGLENINEEAFTDSDGITHIIQTKKVAIVDIEGNSILVGVIRDTTERKQAELKLKEALEFNEGVINAIPDLLFELDREGRYLNIWTHTPELLAVQKEALLGHTVSEMLSPDAAATIMIALHEARNSGISFGKSICIDGPEGKRWFELSVSKMSGSEVSKERFLVLSRDVTGRKQAEDEVLELNADLEQRVGERTVQLEDSSRQLRELAARQENAREEERKHIARELHDDLGQYLTALRLKASALELEYGARDVALAGKLQRLLGLVDDTKRVVRNLSQMLRPAVLDMGIASALEWLVDGFEQRSGIPCELNMPGQLALDESGSMVVFRTVQEALTNIARHAGAGEVSILLERRGDTHVLEVRDDGVGFDPLLRKPASFGLVGMRERALMLGGELSIVSAPGRGALITLCIPVR